MNKNELYFSPRWFVTKIHLWLSRDIFFQMWLIWLQPLHQQSQLVSQHAVILKKFLVVCWLAIITLSITHMSFPYSPGQWGGHCVQMFICHKGSPLKAHIIIKRFFSLNRFGNFYCCGACGFVISLFFSIIETVGVLWDLKSVEIYRSVCSQCNIELLNNQNKMFACLQ